MGITIREKDHWRDRIARRIDHAIDELESKDDPNFRRRIEEKAETQAWKSLGLGELHDEFQKSEDAIANHKQRRDELCTKMLTALGKSDSVGRYRECVPYSITEVVNRRAKVYQRELMESEPLGKRILQLQREKEELLDTVWLATSPVQIKELWSRFVGLLNWEPPELQREALAVPPVTED